MGISVTSNREYKKELLLEIEDLPFDKIKEVMDFVFFIKAKEFIDPSQTYFWTKRWQEMERGADADKETGDLVGNGSVKGLIKELKK